jgi:hypothetical protein
MFGYVWVRLLVDDALENAIGYLLKETLGESLFTKSVDGQAVLLGLDMRVALPLCPPQGKHRFHPFCCLALHYSKILLQHPS